MGDTNALGGGSLLDLLFEDPHVGRCLVAPDGSALRANREWLRSTGLPRDRALRASLAELFPDGRGTALAMHGRACAGQRVELPRRVQRIEGRDTWWEGAIDPVPMDGGTGLLFTTREVSPDPGRQEAERACSANEARYRTLAEDSPVILWARDARGDPEFVNRAFRDFHGVTREQVEGTRWRPVVHPEDAPRFEEAALAAVRDRKSFRSEARVRRADGEWRWIAAYGHPRFGEAAEFLGHVGISVDITDRECAQEALRQSEKKLRVSVANAAIGFALMMPDGHFLEANPVYCALTGYALEELRTMTPWQLVHPDDVAENKRQLERMLAGEFSDFVIENRYRRKDGEVVWVRKSTSVVRDALGEPQWAIGLVEDITSRKRAEEALRESEERLRLFIEHAPAAVAMFDREMRYLAASRRFLGDFRLSLQAVLGRSHYEVFPEVPERWKQIHRRCLAGGVETCDEEPFPRADGAVDWVRWEIHPWHTAAGEIGGIILFTELITERKRSLEALRASEERFRLLVQGVKDCAIYMLSPDGRVTSWSAAAEQMFGYREEEIVGQHRSVLFIAEQRASGKWQRDLEVALADGRAEEEVWRVRKDGTRFWANVLITPLRGEGGGLRGFAIVTRDFTQRKRAESALHESEGRLRASEAALREADRQKNQFLAVLSHELRNPLAPIRNSLYILDRAAPGGEQAKRAQAVVRRQVEQMTWLVDDLLDVTRIAHGKIKLHRERLDLNELAHRTVEDHRTAFANADVRLEVLPAPAEVWVDGDRVRLCQAIGNLLQNAVKFTPRGGKATVSIDPDPARGRATLTVRDTGAGIQAEMLPRLFQPFTQADATLDRSKGGLGLGLALVRGLVELHGGSVRAESDGPGKGAAFTISVPLDVATARSASAQRCVRGEGAPRRVLVIEDNEDAANTLREVLELDEHVVEVAYTGREGLARAQAFHPDVVLCDIGLPEMDGYEVARTIRADPELGGVALVAVSGYAQPEDVAAAKEAGFEAHLAKPPSLEALERTLADVRRQRLGG
jgi:PAS domain S-box-containing protein